MEIETVKMSSRGQIVIPQEIRESIGAGEGTLFAVTKTNDTLVLRKVTLPSKKELIDQLKRIAKEGKMRLEKRGVSEADLRSR